MKITTWNVNSVNARIEHLINFIKNGSNCFLVDFDKNNLNGAINIGSDINEIGYNQKFDLII